MRTRSERSKDEQSYCSTRRFYERNARNYAEATLALSMEPSIENFTARLSTGSRIVDLGCGAGRDLRVFTQRGFHAVGLDASYELGRYARKYSNCPVVAGDLRKLPFASESFSGAWASASLLHLTRDDVRLALSEVRRILRMDGYFFSSIKCGSGEELDPKGRWFSYFEPTEWLSLLEDARLSTVESQLSSQMAGTIFRGESVTWFNSIARKME